MIPSTNGVPLMASTSPLQRRGPTLDPYLFFVGRFVRDGARWLMAILAVIYLAEIGFTNSQVGIVFGFSLAGGFVMSLVVMLTSRGVSTRTWAVAYMLITALAGVLLIFSNDFWLLVIGGFFGSYAASGAHLGAMAQLEQTGISAVVPQERRTRAFSNLTIASAAGRATGALLAGLSTLLINTFEWEPISAYHAILWIYVGMHGLAALVYLVLSKAAHPQSNTLVADQNETSGAKPSLLVNPFKARARRPILTISSLFAFDSFAGGMVFESFLSFWLFTKFGMSAAAIGGLLIGSQALNMVSLVLAPWVARRVGLLNTLVFTQVASNIMLILFAFAPTVIVAIILWLLRSLFDEMDVPTRQAYMMGITETDEHAIMAGTANLGRGLGRIPSATVTGWLWAGALTITPWIAAGTIKIAYDFAIWLAFRRVEIPPSSPDEG